MFQQAIYSLEEVLLISPNAWNVRVFPHLILFQTLTKLQIHARLGEVVFAGTKATSSGNQAATVSGLARAMRAFCRSIELCNDYLRGYYGLKLSTTQLIDILSRTSNAVVKAADGDELPLPRLETIQQLNELATSKLAEIIRKYSTGENGWQGYDEAEVIAARALLAQDSSAPK